MGIALPFIYLTRCAINYPLRYHHRQYLSHNSTLVF